MLTTSRAIVLRAVRHGDRAWVLKVHGERHGLRTFLVRGGRKSAFPAALFQPLARVELVWDERSERDMALLREARVDRPYQSALQDPVKGALLLFTQEVLVRTLRSEAEDPDLHAFLQHMLETIDQGNDPAHFPLLFLLGLAKCLGFLPEPPDDDRENFDLLEGRFLPGEAPSGHTLRPPLSTALAHLLRAALHEEETPRLAASLRRPLLDHLLFYFRVHVDGLRELRSPEVLHQVLG